MATAEKKYKDMTESPVGSLLLRLSVPMVISMLVTGLYNMADTFFVGQLGKTATGAVGVAAPLMNMINAIGYGVGIGGGVVMSNQLGARDIRQASKTASTSFVLCFSLTLILGIGGFFTRGGIVRILGATETIAPYAEQYIQYIFIGMPFMASSITLSNMLRFQGYTSYSMAGNMTGAVLNIILDPLFISVFKLGISGAAIATIISQTISFIVLFVFCKKLGTVEIHITDLYIKKDFLSRMIILGLPTFLRQFFTSMSFVILNYAAKPYGDEALAAMTVASKVIFFFKAFSMGMGQGFQPFCGYNQGAKKYSRIYSGLKFIVLFSVVAISAICIIAFFLSSQIAALFQDDPDVIAIASKALRFQFVAVPFTTAIITTDSAAQALGNIKRVLVLSFLRYGVFQFIFAQILPRIFNIAGVEMLPMCSEIASFVAAVLVFSPMIRSLKNTPDGDGD